MVLSYLFFIVFMGNWIYAFSLSLAGLAPRRLTETPFTADSNGIHQIVARINTKLGLYEETSANHLPGQEKGQGTTANHLPGQEKVKVANARMHCYHVFIHERVFALDPKPN